MLFYLTYNASKAIPSGIPVSGPLPRQFLAMYYFGYYWYCACVILFNAYLEAHGFCLQFSYNCMISVYLLLLLCFKWAHRISETHNIKK